MAQNRIKKMLKKKINRVLFIGSKPLGLRVLNEIYSLSPETLIGVLTINDTNDTRNVFNGFQKVVFSSEEARRLCFFRARHIETNLSS